MLQNRFEIFFRRKLKKLIRRLKHTENFFDEKKFCDFDSNKFRKNKFSYKQSNVNNVNKNDDVQSEINRNESKNKRK